MEDYVRRLCDCGYSDGFARAICMEFMRELGPEMLSEYISEIEAAMVLEYVAKIPQ